MPKPTGRPLIRCEVPAPIRHTASSDGLVRLERGDDAGSVVFERLMRARDWATPRCEGMAGCLSLAYDGDAFALCIRPFEHPDQDDPRAHRWVRLPWELVRELLEEDASA